MVAHSIMKAAMEKTRGILNFKTGEKKFQLSLHPPAPDLRFFIEKYWIVAWDLRGQEPYVQETLPYPCIHLVIEQDHSRIYGVYTGKFARLLENEGRAFGIKFKPGGFYPLMQESIARMTNTSISFREAFGSEASALEEAILSRHDEGEMIVQAEMFLRERLLERDQNIAVVNEIIDYISTHQEITKVQDVLSQLNLHTRTVQRLFRHYVGVSPKWVIRRYRLHEAAERSGSGEVVDWSAMAVELGYSDQAHFIHEFKAVIGNTPGEYAKGSA